MNPTKEQAEVQAECIRSIDCEPGRVEPLVIKTILVRSLPILRAYAEQCDEIMQLREALNAAKNMAYCARAEVTTDIWRIEEHIATALAAREKK